MCEKFDEIWINLNSQIPLIIDAAFIEKVMPQRSKGIQGSLKLVQVITSRERPKSALYLRLKIVKGGTLRALWNSSWLQNLKKNWGGALWRLEKISKKNLKMIFLNSVTVPKKVKVEALWDFLDPIVLQNVEKMKRGPFVQSKKFQKSRIMPKKSGTMRYP